MVEQRCEGMDWIFLAEHMDRLWVLVNRILNLEMSLRWLGGIS